MRGQGGRLGKDMFKLDLEDGFNLALGRQRLEAAHCVGESGGLSPEGPSGDPSFLEASSKVSTESLLASHPHPLPTRAEILCK